jgi:hypothetical protein
MKIKHGIKFLKIHLLFLVLSTSIYAQKKIDIVFKEEIKADLNKYAFDKSEKMIDSTDIYVLKDFKSFAEYNNQGKLQVPEILIFNSSGYLVKNRFNNNECTQVITDIKKINKMKFNKDFNISQYAQKITPLNTVTQNDGNSVYDYYIIINWARFVDNYNEQSFEWYKQLKQNEGTTKIKCYFLNLDVQQSWNLNEKQKKALKMQ